MGSNATHLLLEFYANIDIFLLVFVRMIGFMVVIPVFSGANMPMVSKIGLALYTAGIIVFTGTMMEVKYEPTVFGYSLLIIKEFSVGIIVAYVVYLIFSVLYLAGQMVDYQIGFSMVNVFDPVSQLQVPVTGNLFYLIITLIFVISGGLNTMIYTIAKSYEILPIGSAEIIGNTSLVFYIKDMIINYFSVGIQISMPIVGCILVVDIALGLLTKAVPQMNVFVVGMPIKLFIGLIVLIIVMPMFINVYNMLYTDVLDYVMNVLRGMMPQ